MFAQAFFGEFNTRWEHLSDITWAERAGATVLAVTILFMGLWPSPWVNRISTTIAETIPGVTL
jgi:NADH:ubiquinone oxidoreductase subunit 4 (subunit M)